MTYTPSVIGTASHTITASYSGDPTHIASNGTKTVTVKVTSPFVYVTNSAGTVSQ